MKKYKDCDIVKDFFFHLAEIKSLIAFDKNNIPSYIGREHATKKL